MIKKILIIFILLVSLAAGFAYLKPPAKAPLVSYTTVAKDDYYETILSTGTVVLEGLTDIKTEVSGKIVNLFVKEGDEIAKDQILLEFETIDILLDLQQAEANYILAKARYDEIVNTTCPTSQEQYHQATLTQQELEDKLIKYERLFIQKAVSRDSVEEVSHQLELQKSMTEIQKKHMESCAEGGAKRETALAEIKAAQARIDLLKNKLNRHTIRSPLEGIIIEQHKSLGEYSMIGESLFTIAGQDEKYIEIELDERNLPKIKRGQLVFVSTEFSPENKVKGLIQYIAPSVNIDKGTVSLKVELIEDDEYLIKNLTVRCEIIISEYPDSLIIPQEYIWSENSRFYIYSYQNGKAEKKQIILDNPNAREVRIIEGVMHNEIILFPAGLQANMDVTLND